MFDKIYVEMVNLMEVDMVKLQHFFEADVRIKKDMYNVAFQSTNGYIGENSALEYSNRLSDFLIYVFSELRCIVSDVYNIGLTGCRSNTLQCSNEHDALYSYIIFVLSICLVVCHQCRLSGYAWYFVQRCIYSDIRLLGMAVPRDLRSACFHKVVEGNGRT